MALPLWNAVWGRRLAVAEKLMLLYYANCANEHGRAWPSESTVCDRCGFSRRTMMRARRALIADGYLVKIDGVRVAGLSVYRVYPRGRRDHGDNVTRIDDYERNERTG
jgi:NurA-like 5'-3' nuclease